jgi:hypothetical protein
MKMRTQGIFRPTRSVAAASAFGYAAFLLFTFGLAGSATAIEWPKGFVAHSGTESPNGRYAILAPPEEPDENDNASCYLADVQAHRVLGPIKAVDYFEHQNHADLSAIWNSNSTRSVVILDGRFGFDTITLVELHGDSFRAVDLGTYVEHALNEAAGKVPAKDYVDRVGAGLAYVRLGQDGKIRIRCVTTTNPKSLDIVPSYYALFQGTYDPGAGRWTAADARPINGDAFETLSDAYGEIDASTIQFENEEQRAKEYDGTLNSVYSAVRFILSKPQFEKVKAAQSAWLKDLNTAPSLEEKNKRVWARVKELRDLLW